MREPQELGPQAFARSQLERPWGARGTRCWGLKPGQPVALLQEKDGILASTVMCGSGVCVSSLPKQGCH